MSQILDDRSPVLVFSSGWTLGGSAAEYNATTTYTDQAGANMTLTFQGINVAVYGTIGSSNANKVPPQTTYQLDNNGPITYVPTLTVSAQHYQKFYQSPDVVKGQHTLVVTNQIDGCDPYFIDYLVVLQGDTSSSTTPSTTSTQLLVPSSSTQHSSSGSSKTVAIVAPVVAVLGVILLLALAYLLVRRRRRRDFDVSKDEIPNAWAGPSPIPTNPVVQPPLSNGSTSIEPKDLLRLQPSPEHSAQRDSAPPAYLP